LIYIKNILPDQDFFETLLQDYINKFRIQSIGWTDFQDHYINEVTNKYGDKAADILKQIDWDTWVIKPGQLPHVNDFTNKWSTQAEDSKNALFNGTLTKDFEIIFKGWFTDVKLEFLNKVLARVSDVKEEHYIFLRDTLGLHQGYNMEVENLWYQLSLLTKHKDAYDHIADFLSKIGRMKYIRPIYHAWALLDKQKAYSVFLTNK
jgi:leukotriene-A4 hydrolase